MIATLKYNIPEEEVLFNAALDGINLGIVISELNNFLRQKTKYISDTQTEEQTLIYEEIRNKLYDLKQEYLRGGDL